MTRDEKIKEIRDTEELINQSTETINKHTKYVSDNQSKLERLKAELDDDEQRIHYSELYRSMSDVTDEMWKNDNMCKYHTGFFQSTNEIGYSWNTSFRIQGVTYFTNEQKCRSAISAIGEDNFIKYVLGVKREEAKQESKVREVKRNAVKGEYVKLISDSSYFCHGYKNGDVIYIDGKKEIADERGFIWGVGARSINDYVVLENYTPPVKSENFIYELSYDGTTASFKILKQPEQWRGKHIIFTSSNGVKFNSEGRPELYGYTIYLQGCHRELDNNIAEFNTSRLVFDRISSALIEFKQWADGQSFESEEK